MDSINLSSNTSAPPIFFYI